MAAQRKFDPGLALSLVLVVAAGSTVGAVVAATQPEPVTAVSPTVWPQTRSEFQQPQFRMRSQNQRPLGLSRGS